MNIDSKEASLSRRAYVVQCGVEHLVTIVMGDAFLVSLLTYLNISDAAIGVIASFSSVAFVFQLLSIFLVQSKFSTKKMVISIDLTSTLLFAFVYFLPFLPMAGSAKKVLLVVSMILANTSKNIISSLYFKWANSYVENGKRAVFSAMKECTSLLAGILFSVFMGYVVDRYEDIGNVRGGLMFVAATMLVLNAANFISLILIKDEPKENRAKMNVPFKDVFLTSAQTKYFCAIFL